MLLNIYQSGRNNIKCVLTALYSKEVYAEFNIIIRNSEIVRYEFVNKKLVSTTFSDVCRIVSSYNLIHLKCNVGNSIEFRLDDFEWK